MAEENSKKKLPKAIQKSAEGNIWLIQPTVLTMMRYDYTQMQSKIFLQVVSKMQKSIKEAFNSYKRNKTEDLMSNSLFTDEEYQDPASSESIYLKIPIKDFGVPANQYNQLKEAFKTISSVPIEIEYKDQKGTEWIQFDNLCSVSIPKTSPGRRSEFVHIHIKKKTAISMLSMKSGYTRYLKQTVLMSSNSYTPRFYTLLSLYKTKQKPAIIKLKDLRNMLCLEKKYPRFCDFKRRVLDIAYEDLKLMAQNNVADFWFEWEKIYPANQRKAGEPEAIKFNLRSTETSEIYLNNRANIELKRKSIYDILTSESIHMDIDKAQDICSRLNANNYSTISYKLLTTVEYAKTKNYPRNYLYKTLMNEFDKLDSYRLPFEEEEESDFTEYEEIENEE